MNGLNDNQQGSFPVPRPKPQQRQQQQQINNFLPSSAPVSSLLPPIPASINNNNLVMTSTAIQAQLAALLSQGAANLNANVNVNVNANAAPVARHHQHQQHQHHYGSQSSANSTLSSFLPPPASHNHHQQQPHQQQQQSQLLAARASSTASSSASTGTAANPLLSHNASSMQYWKLEQLEQHIKLMHQLKQHVPQNVTMLLYEARKRAEKRHSKRIANRKSACTSRARKKALVQEMTDLNARLRRQALILSLLPDLVIAIDAGGKITFCSAQVERVLQHSIDDLIGAKLTDIIVPGSRDKLQNLIQALLGATTTTSTSEEDGKPNAALSLPLQQETASSQQQPAKKAKLKKGDEEDKASIDASANAVTDTSASFPLSVVKVDPKAVAALPASSDENDNSDGSNGKQPSSLTNSSQANNSGSDDCGTPKKDDNRAATTIKKGGASKSKEEIQTTTSSDSSNTGSTVSTDAKNLLSANANLERNVRWHNKKIMKQKNVRSASSGYKDDVMFAAVTANNASARLSSLQHMTGSCGASEGEEDSGYRESNDSREESSSSEGENSSESNGRRKPIAPTCNVCLIRDDMTTIWCEVTSSVRIKDRDDEESDDTTTVNKEDNKKQLQLSASSSSVGGGGKRLSASAASIEKASRKRGSEEASLPGSDVTADDNKGGDPNQFKEILLCLRPIRDGDEKTDEMHRFKPSKKKEKRLVSSEDNNSEETPTTNTASSPADGNSGEGGSDPAANTIKKKRSAKPSKGDRGASKRNRKEDDIDNAAVESLMSMSSQKK